MPSPSSVAGSGNLFRTDDPVEVVQKASAVAAALKDILRSQRMVQDIRGKEYVKVEGWQTLGSMLGVVPVVAWTREIEGGWEARVEARTLDGRVIGAAEAMCVAAEGGNWGAKATSNSRRSMAQTRAVSKALRGPLGFVVTLAGYEATPYEEMPVADAVVVDETPRPVPLNDERATELKVTALGLWEKTDLSEAQFKAYLAAAEHSHERLEDFCRFLESKEKKA
jgi:hypothetical protein